MKTLLKSGMYVSLGLAAHSVARANDAIDASRKSLKEREFDGQIIYGILKGKSIEYLGINSKKLIGDKKWNDNLMNLEGLNFKLSDLNELWRE